MDCYVGLSDVNLSGRVKKTKMLQLNLISKASNLTDSCHTAVKGGRAPGKGCISRSHGENLADGHIGFIFKLPFCLSPSLQVLQAFTLQVSTESLEF